MTLVRYAVYALLHINIDIHSPAWCVPVDIAPKSLAHEAERRHRPAVDGDCRLVEHYRIIVYYCHRSFVSVRYCDFYCFVGKGTNSYINQLYHIWDKLLNSHFITANVEYFIILTASPFEDATYPPSKKSNYKYQNAGKHLFCHDAKLATPPRSPTSCSSWTSRW